MRPGVAATATGWVGHRRMGPTEHSLRQSVAMVWIDPDAPEDLFGHHPLWSDRRPAPARFRATDYGDGSGRAIGDQVRDRLAGPLGSRPTGPIRMLTQPRLWGWLFNPITVYVAWDDPADDPIGAVAEVTNTPWKERHGYAFGLVADRGRLRARFDKQLHVSPFLTEDQHYDLSLDATDDQLNMDLDVIDPTGSVIIATHLELELRSANRANLSRMLLRHPASTHRVSIGIHTHAARLWAKGVPFVAHPRRRSATILDPEVRSP